MEASQLAFRGDLGLGIRSSDLGARVIGLEAQQNTLERARAKLADKKKLYEQEFKHGIIVTRDYPLDNGSVIKDGSLVLTKAPQGVDVLLADIIPNGEGYDVIDYVDPNHGYTVH